MLLIQHYTVQYRAECLSDTGIQVGSGAAVTCTGKITELGKSPYRPQAPES